MSDNTYNGWTSYESAERQWFALTESGVVPLGDCGDYEAADEIAKDLALEAIRLIHPLEAQKWADVFSSKGILGVTHNEN